MKLGEFCGGCEIPAGTPSSLYLKTQHKYSAWVIQNVVNGLGCKSLGEAVTFGLHADPEKDKPPVVNGKLKKSRGNRSRGKVVASDTIKTPSVATFAEQLNSLSKEDAGKVKKLVMYLYEKSTHEAKMSALEQEIKNF